MTIMTSGAVAAPASSWLRSDSEFAAEQKFHFISLSANASLCVIILAVCFLQVVSRKGGES